MKSLLWLPALIAVMSFTTWQPDFETAKKIAMEKHQLILLNFSGLDWCGPCMRMRKEIFGDKSFSAMADTTLVMVNADFPRQKKNQLDKQRIRQNEILADKYNPEGKFPFTVLINTDGKVVQSWEGLPSIGVAQFTKQVKTICNANK